MEQVTTVETALDAFHLEMSQSILYSGRESIFGKAIGQTSFLYLGWKSSVGKLEFNIVDRTAFLLEIEIDPKYRKQGFGSQLYVIAERIAARLGCARIEQTPSGWTPSGETRASYLQRRGWVLEGRIAYKRIG